MAENNGKKDNLRAAYSSISDYLNNLVQIRFTVFGLIIAANGFLAAEFFGCNTEPHIEIPILSIVLAFIFLIIEKRTSTLLDNSVFRGLEIEKSLKFDPNIGFFSLMKDQPKGPTNKLVRFIFSHSLLICLFNLALVLFWLFIILSLPQTQNFFINILTINR